MKFRFLTLTLVLVMALSSVSVFADNADNNTPTPVPTVTNDGKVIEPTGQTESGTAETTTQNGPGSNTATGQAERGTADTGAQVGAGIQKNDANKPKVDDNSGNPNKDRDSSKTKPSDSPKAPANPKDPANLLKAPVPQCNTANEYLIYIQGNEAVMQDVIAAYTQGRDEQSIQEIKSKIINRFMEKNLEAANRGLEDLNAKESEFLALAITKAEILVLKAKLYKDANADAQLKIFLGELVQAGKDNTHRIVKAKAETLISKIVAFDFRKRLYAATQNHDYEVIKKLIYEMDDALEKADNGKNATPEMAKSAILVVLYILNDPNIDQEIKEQVRSKFFELLSNATNPETKAVFEKVRAEINKAEDEIEKAKAAEAEKLLKAQEERLKKAEENKKKLGASKNNKPNSPRR